MACPTRCRWRSSWASPRLQWIATAVGVAGVLLGFGAVPPAHAQPVLYNNYSHLPTGEAAALQGGAYIARAQDASASWYNPAGLVHAPADGISGNASIYGYNRASFDGVGTSTDFSSTPTFIGSLTRTVEGNEATRAWGFSIVTPLDTQHASKRDFKQSYAVAGAGTVADVTTVLTDTSQANLFAPGVAWSHALSGGTSFGYGLRLYQIAITGQTGSIFYQDPAAGAPYFSAVENIAFSFEATMARLEAGWQRRSAEGLQIGVVVRSTTAMVRARGRVLTNFQQYFVLGTTPINAFASADNTDVGLNYRLPWEVGLGLAWVQPGWELELDATYYRKLETYQLVKPIDVLIISTVGGGPSTSSTITEPGVTFTGRSFVNLALGGRYRVGSAAWINGGVYTDRSPGTFSGNELFTQVDFTGATGGVTFERSGSSTTLGVLYVQGHTHAPYLATPSIVPEPARTVAIDYRELALILAGSLTF